jgi:hypothetical protein
MGKRIGTFPTVVSLCLIALAACAQPGPRVSQAQVPPGKSGSARVWFLRGSISTSPAVQAFSPVIYVDGAPVAAIPIDTAFYRDFSPGTYGFMVQTNGGFPTHQVTSLQLAPDTEYFLDVDWVPSWNLGYPLIAGSQNFATYAIIPMGPQVAQAYLPTLHYLGEQ